MTEKDFIWLCNEHTIDPLIVMPVTTDEMEDYRENINKFLNELKR